MNDCPRCVGMPDMGIDYSKWPNDGHCKRCGSLDADTFMIRLEAGTISLDPTDKNYKVYVHNVDGERFKCSHRIDKMEDRIKRAAMNLDRIGCDHCFGNAVDGYSDKCSKCGLCESDPLTDDDRDDTVNYRNGEPLNPMKNWKWITEDRNQTKFYFQHLNEDQKRRFIELLNAKSVKINMPGYFYRTPFFIKML